jgi:hypothetical protein
MHDCDPMQQRQAIAVQSTAMNYGQRTLCRDNGELDKRFRSQSKPILMAFYVLCLILYQFMRLMSL